MLSRLVATAIFSVALLATNGVVVSAADASHASRGVGPIGPDGQLIPALAFQNDLLKGLRASKMYKRSCRDDYRELCTHRHGRSGGNNKDESSSSSSTESQIQHQQPPSPIAGSDSSNPPTTTKARERRSGVPMEPCLQEKYDLIQNATCKDFILGRVICWKEMGSPEDSKAPSAGSSAVSNDKDGGGTAAGSVCAEYFEDAIRSHKQAMEEQSFRSKGRGSRSSSSSSSADSSSSASSSSSSSTHIVSSIAHRIQSAKNMCLREEPMYVFSSECTSSTYYQKSVLPLAKALKKHRRPSVLSIGNHKKSSHDERRK